MVFRNLENFTRCMAHVDAILRKCQSREFEKEVILVFLVTKKTAFGRSEMTIPGVNTDRGPIWCLRLFPLSFDPQVAFIFEKITKSDVT
jgi:hypothetical protein